MRLLRIARMDSVLPEVDPVSVMPIVAAPACISFRRVREGVVEDAGCALRKRLEMESDFGIRSANRVKNLPQESQIVGDRESPESLPVGSLDS